MRETTSQDAPRSRTGRPGKEDQATGYGQPSERLAAFAGTKTATVNGSAAMPGYYAYLIGDDDHITARVEIICDDDQEAKRLAKQLVDRQAVELWQEARKLGRFDPNKSLPE